MKGSPIDLLKKAKESPGRPAPSSPHIAPQTIPLQPEHGTKNEFPLESLPPLLKDPTLALIEGVLAPPGLCGQVVLATASLACQGLADIEIDGRIYPCSTFHLTVGESGERKSAIEKIACFEISKYEEELREKFRNEMNDYRRLERQKKELERKINSGRRNSEKAANEKTCLQEIERIEKLLSKRPELPVIRCDEPTMEGLIKTFIRGRPSMGIITDEGAKFFGGYSMSKDNKMNAIGTLSSFWDAKAQTRLRAGEEEPVSLNGVRLTVHLMVQQVILAEIINDPLFREQGILARFLISMPNSTAGERLYRAINCSADKRILTFNKRVRLLLETPMVRSKDGGLNPRQLKVCGEAHKTWVAAHDEFERKLGRSGDWESIRPFAAKAAEHVLRLSGIMTIFNDPSAQEISKESIVSSVSLVRYYAWETFRITNGAVQDVHKKRARILLSWLELWCSVTGNNYVSLRDICRMGPHSLRERSIAEKAVQILEAHQYLIPLDFAEPETGHGKRARRWRFNRGNG